MNAQKLIGLSCAMALLAGLASAAHPGGIDFETLPTLPDPRGHEVAIGNTYDVWGVDFFSKSSNHPRWNTGFYNNPGWFVIGGYQTPPYFPGTAQMGMDFDTPMAEVSMDLFSGTSIHFWTYDEQGQYIPGVTDISPGGGWATKTIIAPPGKKMTRVVFEGMTNSYVVAMDNLNYVVPEPGSAGLMLLASVGFLRRRRA